MKKLTSLLLALCMVLSLLVFSAPTKVEAANEKEITLYLEKGDNYTVTYTKGVTTLVNNKYIATVKRNKTKFTIKAVDIGGTYITIKDAKKKVVGRIELHVVKKGRKAIDVDKTLLVGINEFNPGLTHPGFNLLSTDKVYSSDKSIATAKISRNLLVIKVYKEGEVKITVKSKTGKQVLQYNVTAKFDNKEYIMEIGDGDDLSCQNYKIISGEDNVKIDSSDMEIYSLIFLQAVKEGTTKIELYKDNILTGTLTINIIPRQPINDVLDTDLKGLFHYRADGFRIIEGTDDCVLVEANGSYVTIQVISVGTVKIELFDENGGSLGFVTLNIK